AGAGLLLACAAFLAIGQILVGPPRQPLPDLPVVAATALVPLAIATRLVGMPGAAVAVCGAYLLPASLVSLLFGEQAQPPLLLAPAFAFDLGLWLDHSRLPLKAGLNRGRAVIAGALF